MGIYDREYYRREGHSFLGSFGERGKVCKWLVGINVVAFIIQMVTRESVDYEGLVLYAAGPFTEWLQLDPSAVVHGQVWRLLTYAFLHSADFMHILFNMLFLWWFGSDVEDLYGPKEFLTFYLTSAVMGGLAFMGAWAVGIQDPRAVCVGASGAVTAVLVLCALHFPTRVILLFFILPVPIWLFVLFSVGKDAYALLTGTAGRVAVSVHLGGAALAYVYYRQHWRLSSLFAGMRGWVRMPGRRPRLRVYREERQRPEPAVVAPTRTAAGVDEHLEAQVDAVLEKVKRTGMDSLSDSERQILVRASEVFRRRRT